MKIFRRLYDWVLHWADSPYGVWALFIIAFAEASFFPIPPDPLLIALVLGSRQKAFKFGAVCTLGSVTGAMLGYGIGHFAWYSPDGQFSSFANLFFNNIPGFTHELFANTKLLYEEWDFWVVFTAGFTPIPFKVFTIAAGAFHISIPMLILASTISRGARFFLFAWLIWKYGDPIRRFIDKQFNWLAIAFTVLLVGSFVLLKYLV